MKMLIRTFSKHLNATCVFILGGIENEPIMGMKQMKPARRSKGFDAVH